VEGEGSANRRRIEGNDTADVRCIRKREKQQKRSKESATGSTGVKQKIEVRFNPTTSEGDG